MFPQSTPKAVINILFFHPGNRRPPRLPQFPHLTRPSRHASPTFHPTLAQIHHCTAQSSSQHVQNPLVPAIQRLQSAAGQNGAAPRPIPRRQRQGGLAAHAGFAVGSGSPSNKSQRASQGGVTCNIQHGRATDKHGSGKDGLGRARGGFVSGMGVRCGKLSRYNIYLVIVLVVVFFSAFHPSHQVVKPWSDRRQPFPLPPQHHNTTTSPPQHHQP